MDSNSRLVLSALSAGQTLRHGRTGRSRSPGERTHRSRDCRIAPGPIKTTAGQKLHAGSIPARNQPEAVVLDFVNPTRPDGRPIGGARQARFDKPFGRGRTLHNNMADKRGLFGRESRPWRFDQSVMAITDGLAK
jgi:hypothetical protein